MGCGSLPRGLRGKLVQRYVSSSDVAASCSLLNVSISNGMRGSCATCRPPSPAREAPGHHVRSLPPQRDRRRHQRQSECTRDGHRLPLVCCCSTPKSVLAGLVLTRRHSTIFLSSSEAQDGRRSRCAPVLSPTLIGVQSCRICGLVVQYRYTTTTATSTVRAQSVLGLFVH